MKGTHPNCAVIFKAYFWDDFVERQARRMAEAAGNLDFYISFDESGGPAGSIPFPRVIRFTCKDLAAAGLPMRAAVGGVLWWNPDYAHYQFLQEQPNYDYYLFVEYDCVLQGSVEDFVNRAMNSEADLVAFRMESKFHLWHWWPYQRKVYYPDEVQRALLCVCFLSAPALRRLHQRRLAMGADRSVTAWPNSELFVATEVVRAGMTWLPLGDFVDLSHYGWFPPMLEEDLPAAKTNAFIHPVLDRRRYLASMLHNRGSLQERELQSALERFSPEEYAEAAKPVAGKGLIQPKRYKFKRRVARVLHVIEQVTGQHNRPRNLRKQSVNGKGMQE
jgi:hypothetical protein